MKNKFLLSGALRADSMVSRRCAHWCSLAQERYRGSSPFGGTTKVAAVTGGCLR
jgi:hypothetical protein